MSYRNNAYAIVVALAATACATTTRPSPASPAAPPLPALARDLDAILAQPALQHGYWGVVVKSLARDETLFAVNARKLMLPASSMKVVTLAAAAEKLGWEFRYETTLHAAGPVEAGTLQGDLVVVGTGDPSLGAADGMAVTASAAATPTSISEGRASVTRARVVMGPAISEKG